MLTGAIVASSWKISEGRAPVVAEQPPTLQVHDWTLGTCPSLLARNNVPALKAPVSQNSPNASAVAVSPARGPLMTSTIAPGSGRNAASCTTP